MCLNKHETDVANYCIFKLNETNVRLSPQNNSWLALSRNPDAIIIIIINIRKLFSGYIQKIVLLYEINKDDTSLILKSVRFPNPQIFVEIFCTNLQSPVWSSLLRSRFPGCHAMLHPKKQLLTSEQHSFPLCLWFGCGLLNRPIT